MCPVKKGQIIFELSDVGKLLSLRALSKASSKLPFRTKVIRLFF